MSSVPHLAGTDQDLEQAVWLRDQFLDSGLDRATVVPYHVLLSYPDMEKPNKVYLMDSSGQPNFTTSGRQTPLFAQEEYSDLVAPNFNAYSGTGTIETVHIFLINPIYYYYCCSFIRHINVLGWPSLRLLRARSSLRLFSQTRNRRR